MFYKSEKKPTRNQLINRGFAPINELIDIMVPIHNESWSQVINSKEIGYVRQKIKRILDKK